MGITWCASFEFDAANAALGALYLEMIVGVAASSLLYGLAPDFIANAVVSAAVFVASATSLWRITTRAAERADTKSKWCA